MSALNSYKGDKMIIVVEGIDRIGKTTLCNRLSKELQMPIYKESGVHEATQIGNVRSQMSLLNLCKVTGCNVIFDRLFSSEYVYGMCDRKCSPFVSKKFLNMAIDLFLQIPDAIYISMQSTDVEKSSAEHGTSLRRHSHLFVSCDKLLIDKGCENFYAGTYDDIDDIVDELVWLYGGKTNG